MSKFVKLRMYRIAVIICTLCGGLLGYKVSSGVNQAELKAKYDQGYEDASWFVVYDTLTGDSRDYGSIPVEVEKILELQAIERFRYWWFGRYSPLDLVFQWHQDSSVFSLEVCKPLNLWRWDKGVFANNLEDNEPLFFYVVGNPWHGTRVTGKEIKQFYDVDVEKEMKDD